MNHLLVALIFGKDFSAIEHFTSGSASGFCWLNRRLITRCELPNEDSFFSGQIALEGVRLLATCGVRD